MNLVNWTHPLAPTFAHSPDRCDDYGRLVCRLADVGF
jgi:hypothetical protein